jgi:hypothetical protein
MGSTGLMPSHPDCGSLGTRCPTWPAVAGQAKGGPACGTVSRSIIGMAAPSSSPSSIVTESEMAVRIPQSLSSGLSPETGLDVLAYELREQKAQTLGALGGQVERALAEIRAFDAAKHGLDWEERRRAMLDDAADLVWAFMIQRELCGFRNWEAVVKDYNIPREVLNRVGQVRRKVD